MNDLSQHYSQLRGLSEGWLVVDVDLDLSQQTVVIRLMRNPAVRLCCPECGEQRPHKDYSLERSWRHLDTAL